MSSSDRDGSKTPRSKSKIHIVVDNSNLCIGAQLGQGKNGKQDASIRVNVPKLVQIIEKNKKSWNIKTKIVGGSIPPSNGRIWTEWEKCNYTCLLGERSRTNKEVFLDDMLHSQIQSLILKNRSDEDSNVQQNLILITGDGNANDNRTSFPDIVTIALNYGWNVEIWSWKASCSYKFIAIQEQYPAKMKINYFDTSRSFITFRQKRRQKEQQLDYFKYSIIALVVFLFLLFVIYYLKR